MEIYTIIHEIPVLAVPALPLEEVNEIISDLIQIWIWEDSQPGEVELISEEQLLSLFLWKNFDPPVPLKSNKNEV